MENRIAHCTKNQLQTSLLSTDFGYLDKSDHAQQDSLFICMQKINLIPPFFFEILQSYYKIALLGTLGMPGYDQ